MKNFILFNVADLRGAYTASYYSETDENKKLGVNEIAKKIGVSKMTLYKYLRYKGVEISHYQSAEVK
jgi:DNA-binding phage protein